MYITIGGAERNSYIGKSIFHSFISLSNLKDSLASYFSGILFMFGGRITNQGVAYYFNEFLIIKMLIAIVGIIIVAINIVSYIRNKKVDYLSLVLSIGYVFVSGICIITTINAPRYYSYAPFVLSIIIIRYLCTERIELIKKSSTKVVVALLGASI